MSRARSQAIVEGAEMSSVASEVREGLDNLAEAIRTHAAVMASLAAVEHSRDYPDQRDMAQVIYEDARSLWAEMSNRIDAAQRQKLTDYIDGICKGKRK